jgi:hypothetical protein
MKKIFFSMLTLLVWSAASMNAQVLIGGDGTGDPDPSAVLELQSSDHGLLLPRVALTSTGASAPLAAFVKGMTVYNTASTGDVTEGTYYCNGVRWVKVRNSTELINQSDLSEELEKLVEALIKTGLTPTNNCPSSVEGSKGTYAVADFGAAGCWMIDNSKEGIPSATHYMQGLDGELPEGLAGYYYTWEAAQSACPQGFVLPTWDQMRILFVDYLDKQPLAYYMWLYGGTGTYHWSGWYASEYSGWGLWDEAASWWCGVKGDQGLIYEAGGLGMGKYPDRDNLVAVRCIMN